jgi:flagellar basal-body rod modification protein FlgD
MINNELSSLINELSLGAPAKEAKNKNSELGQEDFLELMITQLKNQDPFAPMENGEFIAQMAQFSSVTGLAKLQNSFDRLATSLESNQALQASSLVGRTVLVPSQVANLKDEGGISGSVDLPSSSGAVSLTIMDGAGQVIRKMPLGTHSAGEVYFNWDGFTDTAERAPKGQYFITATAEMDGETSALGTFISASVESVTLNKGSNNLSLNLADGNMVSLSSIREIR